MRYLFIGATVAILLLTACGPAATPETVPTPPPATPTPAQTTFDSPLPAEMTPLPPTAEPPTAIPPSAGTTFDSPLPPEVTPLPLTAEPPPPMEQQETDRGRAVMGEAVIIYQRSGGFAGVHEQWAIYSDGRITASDGSEWQMTPEQVEQLLDDIETLGFFEMKNRYMPLKTCCDRFTYEITVRSGDRINTVTTIDASPDAPPELWRVIEEITRLVSE